MFRIKLIQVGKTKKGPLQELSAKYLKRLSAYAKIETIIVKELTAETFNKDGFTIVLSEDGQTMDSHTFANALESWSENRQRELTFVIAGPFGFDRALAKNVDLTLSLSPMTMPHELALVVLLEQLYRAGTILSGKTYHY